GLPLEQRALRARLRADASGRDVLCLYGHTGSLAVAAAGAGARSTTCVDTASTYLAWSQRNLRAAPGRHTRVRSDVIEYLQSTAERYDIVTLDPPARSMNRATNAVFELAKDYGRLVQLALRALRPAGAI